jgi:hypothetical protein
MHRRQRTWPQRLLRLITAGVLLGAVLGLAFSFTAVPGYRSSAFLLVTPAGLTPLQTSEVQYAQALSQVVPNPSVLRGAGVLADPDSVRADASPNAPLIEITVNAPSADLARRQTQAAAEAVVAYTQDRVDLLGFRAVVLAPATGGRAAGLSLPAYVAAGAALGAVLAALVAMIRGEAPETVPASLPAHQALHAADAQRAVAAAPTTARSS